MYRPKETVYIDPVYQGNSSISDIPMTTPLTNTNVVYGENPNLVVNENGQTIVNPDIPVLIHQPTPKELAQQHEQDIKDTENSIKDVVKNIVNPKPAKNTTEKPVENLIKDLKNIQTAKTTTTTKPKTNYVLYGLIGIGALILFMGIFKEE